MNEETNDFLKENLEEAHTIFHSIIREMKENNIVFSYGTLEAMESNSYQEVNEKLNTMGYYVLKSKDILEKNSEMYNTEYSLYIKYFALYVVSLLFIKLYHKIFNTSELNDMVKYIVGLFLGSTYIGLLNKDIQDNRSDTKEKRDAINDLKTMKEDYKKIHDEIVHEIDSIFAINSGLWDMLDQGKVKKK